MRALVTNRRRTRTFDTQQDNLPDVLGDIGMEIAAADAKADAADSKAEVAQQAADHAEETALESRNRATHTGTQAISTVDGLQDELDDKLAVDGEAATVATIAGLIVAGSNVTISGDGTAADPYSIASTDGGSFESLTLTDSSPSVPSSGEVTLFRREIAGRQYPAFIGPVGGDSALQPLLARNKVGFWNPPGGATTVPGVFGFTAPTTTSFTVTARTPAATNMFTRTKRIGYVTAATAGAVGNWCCPAQFTTGNGAGLGGFTFIMRFGISDEAPVAGARMFVGMRTSVAPANVEPSTLTSCVGVGHGAADTNLKIFYGGSAAQAPIDLGANFPINTGSVDFYELALFSDPGVLEEVRYQVTRLNTGHVATGTLSGSTVIVPSATTFIGPWCYRTNNATALAVGLDVMSCYLETDF